MITGVADYPFLHSSDSMRTICILFLLLTTLLNHNQAADRPNIIVFLVDDMGIMDTSVPFLTDEAGKPKTYPLNRFYRTPAMERLAAQGIRFNQFNAMSVCSPTRISILTGQNAARHRSTNWINPREDNRGTFGPNEWDWDGLDKDDVTLPRVLQANGYRTIHVGKAHFGPFKHEGSNPLNLGFDINIAGDAFGAPGSYLPENNYGAKMKAKHRQEHTPPHLEAYYSTDTFLSEALTIEAKKVVSKTVEEKQPFFLHLSHYAVHSPFETDPRFEKNYQDSAKPKNAKAFATLIEGMDKSLGDMLDHLDELGIAENTFVLFLGDNGSDAPLGHQHEVACAAPLRGKKGAHYEGGMRVPFIAAWAKTNPKHSFQKQLPIPADTIQPHIASVTDLYPTLLKLTNSENPDGHTVDGFPLQTLLTGAKDDPEHPDQFLMHYPHGKHRSSYFTTWRDGDWKLIYHAIPNETAKQNKLQSGGKTYQLFNLQEDPFEQKDLAEANPEKIAVMVQGMLAALEAKEAVFPIDKNGNPLKPSVSF